MPQITHATNGTNLAEIIELILDKGVVIAGDIRIQIVEVELLTISIRLLISSVDRAREMGIDWWTHTNFLSATPRTALPAAEPAASAELEALKARIERLERSS